MPKDHWLPLQRKRAAKRGKKDSWLSRIKKPKPKLKSKEPPREMKGGRRNHKQKQAKLPYHEYILSRQWISRRNEKLRLSEYKCERCGSTHNLQVHHKHYRRLGREKMRDLETLCRFCHEDEHADKVLPTDPISLEFAEMVKSF